MVCTFSLALPVFFTFKPHLREPFSGVSFLVSSWFRRHRLRGVLKSNQYSLYPCLELFGGFLVKLLKLMAASFLSIKALFKDHDIHTDGLECWN